MANLADEMRKEQVNKYDEFVEKYDKKLRGYTKGLISQYGQADMRYGSHIHTTNISWGDITMDDLPLLKRWIEDNGFYLRYGQNAYGVKKIIWYL